jgi:hypothetical protein
MKHVHLTLGYLREQRAQIDAAIATLETLLGGRGGNGNGHGHAATLTAAAAALAQHTGAQPGRTPRVQTKEAKREQRARTQALLERYDRNEPRPFLSRGMQTLLRWGYLKRKGDGYVRTAKPFVP